MKARSQEFYALLLLLVTGVYGVFVSLDLFVLLPVLRDRRAADVSADRHLGLERRSAAAGHLRLGVRADRRRHQGIRRDEADPVPAVRVGVHPGRHPGALRGRRTRRPSRSSSWSRRQFDPQLQSWVFLAFYVGFGILAGIWPLHTWSPDGHASAPTAVSMLHAGVLMKLGAYGVVRLGMGLLPDGHGRVGVAGRRDRLRQHRLRRAERDGPDRSQVRHRLLVGLAHGRGHARRGDADRVGLNGAVFQMFAHGIMTGLFFALVGLVYEKAHSRAIFTMGGFGTMMPGIATAFTIGGLSSLGLPATAGFVAEFLTFLGAWQSAHSWWLFPAVIGAFLTSIYVLRVTKQIFWGPPTPTRISRTCPTRRGRSGPRCILVAVILLFGDLAVPALGPVDTATMPLLNRLWVLQ